MKIRIAGIIGDLFEAIGWRIMKASLSAEYREIELGSCRFFGDSAFLEKANEALRKLREIDPATYESVSTKKITIVGPINEKSYFRQINRRFCIHPWMLDNGIDAIIYGIVTGAFVDSEFATSGRFKNRLIHTEPLSAYRLVAKWLTKHEFDKAYIEQMERTS